MFNKPYLFQFLGDRKTFFALKKQKKLKTTLKKMWDYLLGS